MSFDDVANRWDTKVRRERAKVLAAFIKKELGTDKIKTMLEFGCGTGLLTYFLYSDVKEVYGYDLSEGMQNVFERKKKLLHADNVHLLAEKSELRKHSFDLIFSSMVFHHIVNVKKEIEELKTCLSPAGKFILIDLDEEDGTFHKNEPDFQGHNGFNREKMKEMLFDCGFTSVEMKTAYEGTKIVDDKTISYSLFITKATVS